MNFGAASPPAFDARRRALLAFTCAVHLLALFLWSQERRPLSARPSGVVTFFLQTDGGRTVSPPTRAGRPPLPIAPAGSVPIRVPAPVPVPEPVPVPLDQADADADARAQATPTQASPAPGAASMPDPFDTAGPADGPADGTAAARANTAAQGRSTSTQGGLVSILAKHQAGRVDRELRKGKPGVPVEADTPWARFQRGLGSAHADGTLTWQTDTYTAPDGVVIYRFRQGKRVHCRRSGGIGVPLRGMPDDASASLATASSVAGGGCPSGVAWQRDGP